MASALKVSAQADADQVRVVFTCYDWAKRGVEEVYYRNGDQYELIEMRNLSRTKPYVYSGPERFQLFKKVSRIEEGGAEEVQYQVCGETVIQQNGGRVLVVISPETDESSVFEYRIYTLEDSLSEFPRNSFRLVSFANETLYFQIEDRKPQKIEPGQRLTIKPDLDEAGFVSVVFRDAAGDLLYSKKWYSEPEVRDLVFLRNYDGRRGKGRLGVRIITEVVKDLRPSLVE